MEKTRQKGFAAWFIDNWKRKPLFSTGIALLVMVFLRWGLITPPSANGLGRFRETGSTFCATTRAWALSRWA